MMNEAPGSADADRVRDHTAVPVNERIDAVTATQMRAAMAQGKDAVYRRLAALDHEWDVDRALMLNFAVIGGLSSQLGLRHEGWKWFFRTQLFFLAFHALVGWCPPALVFRRMGFRTSKEIAAERHLLLEWLQHAHPGH